MASDTAATSYPGRWWHALADGRVQCDLCPRDCKLHEGQRGLCFVRKMEGGRMVLTTYGRSSGFCIDPVEKKPLNHFYPGTSILSFGTAGCNLACKFCQNWDISKSRDVDRLQDQASPDAIAQAALRLGCKSVAFTYNDPVIFAEYAMDIADACRAKGVQAVAVTAGYIHAEPRREFYAKMDAANVDLKGFTDDFYYKICGGRLQPVLDTLVYLVKETKVWTEITTLLIPGKNDSDEELKAECRWIRENLGPDVPLHFTAFHPDWKMTDIGATPPATLTRAREIGQLAGLNYVYTGNVHDPAGGSTCCPACEKALIVRDWYDIRGYHLTDEGACSFCGTKIAGRFQKFGKPFGPRRIPVRLQEKMGSEQFISFERSKPGSAGWLASLCSSRILAATWFVAYSAVLPLTQAAWGLSGKEAGLIQSGFHLGYLTSLFIVGFIADHFGAKRAYITMGVAACISPWAFVLFADGFWSAFWLHALTGLCQGGSYTPALALINDHVERSRRGRAMGYLIAGSSAGYALCLGVAGLALKQTDWRGALAVVACLPVFSWLLGAYVLRGTQNFVHPRPAGESLLGALPAVLRNRKGMLSIWGYTFHNWELLGLWAWLPAFLTAALIFHGSDSQGSASIALMLTGLTYLANVLGSITGGTMADRWGRTRTILLWSCVSLALSFSIGWLIALPIAVLAALACLYNFAAIADSSTHSTVLAESVPPHYLGVAYAVRSVVGFGAGVVSPVAFGWALDSFGGKTSAEPLGWGIAWATLGVGGLLGPLATWRLQRMAGAKIS